MMLGTDPEFVILNAQGTPVPAHTIFPTFDKKNKWAATYGGRMTSDASAFRDGYNVEFNLAKGFNCRAQLLDTLKGAMQQFCKLLPEGHKLAALPAYRVDLNDIILAPDDVREFGCDPSFSAYSEGKNIVTLDALTHPWRYAGGHLHFTDAAITAKEKVKVDDQRKVLEVLEAMEFPKDARPLANSDNYPTIIKLMDLYLGLPLSLIFHNEGTFRRRQYYGKAGEFRPQAHIISAPQVSGPSAAAWPNTDCPASQAPYMVRTTMRAKGVEYRTPGPEIFTHTAIAALSMAVGRWVILNFAALEKKWDKSIESELQDAINNGKGGERLLQKIGGLYDPDVVKALRAKALWDPTPDTFLNIADDSMTSWPEYPMDYWKIKVPNIYSDAGRFHADSRAATDSTFVEIPKQAAG